MNLLNECILVSLRNEGRRWSFLSNLLILIYKWALIFEANLEVTSFLVCFDLRGNGSSNKSCLTLVVEVYFLNCLKVISFSFLEIDIVRWDVSLTVTHSTSRLRHKLLLSFRGIVYFSFISKIDVIVFEARHRSRITVVLPVQG